MARAISSSGRNVAEHRGPLGYALATAARRHRADLASRLAVFGLHLGQELVLIDLHYNPGSSQSDVVARLGIEQPTIAKTLARMERAGFVGRTRDQADRRLSRLRLTSQGRQAVDAVLLAWEEADVFIASALTASQTKELLRLLSKVSAPP